MFNTLFAYFSQDVQHIIGLGFGFCLLIALLVFASAYVDAVLRRDRFRKAIPARAKIVHIGRPFGNGTFGSEILNITLDVIPPDAAPYQVKNVWCFEPIALAKAKDGDEIAVRIHAKNREEIFSAEKWAWNVSQIPTRYGDKLVIAYQRR
jgi:hypothetical protein